MNGVNIYYRSIFSSKTMLFKFIFFQWFFFPLIILIKFLSKIIFNSNIFQFCILNFLLLYLLYLFKIYDLKFLNYLKTKQKTWIWLIDEIFINQFELKLSWIQRFCYCECYCYHYFTIFWTAVFYLNLKISIIQEIENITMYEKNKQF